MVNKKIKTKKLPGFTPGTPWYKDGSLTDAGKTGMGYVSGGAGLVGNVAELMRQPDNANWVANIGGNAGKFASMGSALGVPGAIAGGVIGAGLGIVESIEAQKNIDMAKKQKEIDETVFGNMYASDAIRTNYNMSNFKNNSVSGFKKGTPVFKSKFNNPSVPNAMLSPGEGVVDGTTGRISVVPGNEGISTDTIPANLTNGSMVGSKMKQQVIPGGKSTPADILKRLEMVQSNNDKLLSNKKIRTKLESDTININKFNIQNQIENLRKYNTLVNPNPVQTAELPGYAGGGTIDINGTRYEADWAWIKANKAKILQKWPNAKTEEESDLNKLTGRNIFSNSDIYKKANLEWTNQPATIVSNGFENKSDINIITPEVVNASTTSSIGVPAAGAVPTIENKVNTVKVTGSDGKVTQTIDNGSGRQRYSGATTPDPNNIVVNNNVITERVPESDKPIDRINVDPNKNIINIENSQPQNSLLRYSPSSVNLPSGRPGQVSQPNPYSSTENPTMDEYNKIIAAFGKSVSTVQSAIQSPVQAINDIVGKLNFNPTATTPNEATQSSSKPLSQGNGTNVSPGTKVPENASKAPLVMPTITITEVSNNDADNAAKLKAEKDLTEKVDEKQGVDFGSLANSLGSLAPIAFNAWNSKPEIIKPVYESYVNPNQRYNISTKLAALQKEKSVARSNFKNTNTGSGSNAAFASSISANGLDKLTGLMSEAENTNNVYRKEYANTANEFSRMNNAEKRRVNDLAMKQEAAGRAIWGKNAEMLSQYSQTQELMKNQRLSDKNNSNIFAIYASASPELKKVLRKDNPGLFGNA